MVEEVKAPDFIIIGAQRCGTTSLYNYLARHPNVSPARKKELHFFSFNFAKGPGWYQEQLSPRRRGGLVGKAAAAYRSLLALTPSGKLIRGEASPYYFFHPHAPQRAARLAPRARIIVLLRNPIDRAFSHYNHEVRRRHEPLSFADALANEGERLRGEAERMLEDESYYSFAHQHYSYLSRGIYVDQLEAWMRLFPSEQMLILKAEDFYRDPGSAVGTVQGFLNLPRTGPEVYKNSNGATYGEIDASLRRELVDYFRPHNQRLYDLLGVNYGWE